MNINNQVMFTVTFCMVLITIAALVALLKVPEEYAIGTRIILGIFSYALQCFLWNKYVENKTSVNDEIDCS